MSQPQSLCITINPRTHACVTLQQCVSMEQYMFLQYVDREREIGRSNVCVCVFGGERRAVTVAFQTWLPDPDQVSIRFPP